LTIRPAADLRSSGSIACVTATAPMKLVSITRRTAICGRWKSPE